MSTLVEYLKSDPKFSTLVAAVESAGLVDTLNNLDANLTVFAPTNEAFEEALSILNLTAEELLKDKETLTSVLTYHVLGSKVYSNQISDGMEANTLNGEDVEFSVTEEGGVFVNDAKVVEADVETSNAVVHVIDTVLLPEDILDVQNEDEEENNGDEDED